MSHTGQLSAALAGRYEIEREIGAGGMATVYCARDLKHDRRVALKVLKPELAIQLGTERFLAEIRFTANLQHPNLLPLFDSGAADGLLFYVMPFVEGETLRDQLRRVKQLPVGEAVHVATSIAAALDYAHRHGIVHRDLKPENILLHEGEPLIADFGIALAVSNAGRQRITQTGMSLGTPQYMSPEQATGDRQIDGRTDIYSLGVVLYEMLAGDPPFIAGTAQAVVSKILIESPRPLRVVRAAVPAAIDDAVLRAIEKLPADRFATAREFADALRDKAVSVPPQIVTPGSVRVARRSASSRRRISLGLLPWALVLLVAAAAFIEWMRLGRSTPAPTMRFMLNIPSAQRFTLVNGVPVVFSPDGRAIVYSGAGGPQGRQLYYRRLDELDARPVPGTDNASTLFVSPDGKTVGFSQLQVLRTVSLSGGPPVTIASGGFRSPSWADNGDIYLGSAGGILRIRASRRTIDTLTQPDSAKNELSHGTPLLTPDGKALVFWIRATPPRSDHLALFDLQTKQTRDLDGDAVNPLGFLDGYLVFGRLNGTINAVRFDNDLRSVADAVPLLQGVVARGTGGVAASLSRDGSLVYVRGGLETQLAIADESGKTLGVPTEPRDFTDPLISAPSFSPDGRRIAVAMFESGASDIWLYDTSSSILSRLTSHRGVASNPLWMPDGSRIAFIDRIKAREIWTIPADGSGPEEKLATFPELVRRLAVTPDGKYMLINGGALSPESPGTAGLWLLPLKPLSSPISLTRSRFSELNPAVSADGRWIAYQSNVTGRYEIYVRRFPMGTATQLSATTTGATDPQWTRDGRLLYRVNDSLVVATLSYEPEPRITKHHSVFEARVPVGVSSDGRRFALLRSNGEDQDVVVVLNWRNEVRAKLADAPRK
jgi:Tol biopolymer transport system component/tRNA A-37 threonylcarbamoyl transferase component Bud32